MQLSAQPLGGTKNAQTMRSLLIDSGSPPLSYGTFAEAVSAAERHPLQDRARSSAKLLSGARVTGGNWTAGDCEVTFSNGRLLHVEARDFELHWEVREGTEPQESAGYEPVEFVWNSEVKAVFDPCSLLAQVLGADFTDLFVNESGLLLYTRGNPILWFHAVRDQETNQDLLFAVLED